MDWVMGSLCLFAGAIMVWWICREWRSDRMTVIVPWRVFGPTYDRVRQPSAFLMATGWNSMFAAAFLFGALDCLVLS